MRSRPEQYLDNQAGNKFLQIRDGPIKGVFWLWAQCHQDLHHIDHDPVKDKEVTEDGWMNESLLMQNVFS